MVALLIPTHTIGGLLAGMWPLLSGTLGAVPKTLVWDNESGIGQPRRLTVGARAASGAYQALWETVTGERRPRQGQWRPH